VPRCFNNLAVPVVKYSILVFLLEHETKNGLTLGGFLAGFRWCYEIEPTGVFRVSAWMYVTLLKLITYSKVKGEVSSFS